MLKELLTALHAIVQVIAIYIIIKSDKSSTTKDNSTNTESKREVDIKNIRKYNTTTVNEIPTAIIEPNEGILTIDEMFRERRNQVIQDEIERNELYGLRQIEQITESGDDQSDDESIDEDILRRWPSLTEEEAGHMSDEEW